MSAIGSSAVSGEQTNSSKIAPDFTAIKKKQQATWSSGDYSVVASRIVYQAEQLCETADLQAGWRVLDVATGSAGTRRSRRLGAGVRSSARIMRPSCWSAKNSCQSGASGGGVPRG